MQQQTVKGNGFWLKGIELDLSELAFLDFTPTVNPGLGFLSFTAVQAAQELIGVVARSGLAVRRTSEGFDRVTAQQFAPVVIEEIAGSEDVAPGHVSTIGDDHSDDAFIL